MIDGQFRGITGANFNLGFIQELASSVNTLVETVDRGIGKTGEVLAAVAETDLTRLAFQA
jgi:methyl-accepting chemotaxis protein